MATSSFEDRCVFHRRQNYYHFLDNLKTSLQKFYVQHHDLTDRYEISISQMIMDLLLFTYNISFLCQCYDFGRTVYMSKKAGVL